jgi:ubiquinone biosynthesis protein UbiJ
VIDRPVLDILQRALNHYVRESTAAVDLLAELDGSSFAVDIAGTGLRCVLVAETDAITLCSDVDRADATLRATPLDLLKLARADGASDLKDTRAELTGDLQVAERFAALLKLSRPDLEEELSHWIGGIAARQIGQAASDATGWLARAGRALESNTAEFLQEESRTLPAPLEARAFYADVERLRDDVERAAARLSRLEQRRAAACAASDSY